MLKRIDTISRKQVLVHQYDDDRRLFYVETGYMLAAHYDVDGNRIVMQIAGPGDIIGNMTKGGVMPYEIMAISEATIQSIELSPYKTNEVLRKELTRTLNLHAMGHGSVLQRVSACILMMHEISGGSSSFPFWGDVIADYLGITIESVSRAVRTLKDQGAVTRRPKTGVTIINKSILEANAIN